MTTVDLNAHRSAMADMRIAYITEPAERRMQTQTASDQLRFARAESLAFQQTCGKSLQSAQSKFDLCKYLISI